MLLFFTVMNQLILHDNRVDCILSFMDAGAHFAFTHTHSHTHTHHHHHHHQEPGIKALFCSVSLKKKSRKSLVTFKASQSNMLITKWGPITNGPYVFPDRDSKVSSERAWPPCSAGFMEKVCVCVAIWLSY
jgi:hypothetical protein